jgi:hypothetical protein
MDKRKGILPELIIPIAAIGFAIYYLSTVWQLPFQAKVIGLYVGSAIGILSAILFVRFGIELFTGKKSFGVAGFSSDSVTEWRRWTILGLTCAFIGLMQFIGFVVSIFLFVFLAVLIIGGIQRLKPAILTATGMTVVAFLIFIVFVKVRFPTTIIDETLKDLFL